jgi:hypothetical protein
MQAQFVETEGSMVCVVNRDCVSVLDYLMGKMDEDQTVVVKLIIGRIIHTLHSVIYFKNKKRIIL